MALAASYLQLYDEAGQELGGLLPMDPSILEREVGPGGIAEFPYRDGVYRSLGHIGNFVFALRRVRRYPGEDPGQAVAPDPAPPAMDMTKLAGEDAPAA